jgi:hypothetical protein
MAHELQMGDDSILRMALIGNVSGEDMEALLKDIQPFFEAVTEAEPLCLLVDSSRSGKTSATARKAYVELNRDHRLKKSAVLGANRYSRVLGSFILKATGRDNVRFFDSEEEAIAWLKGES